MTAIETAAPTSAGHWSTKNLILLALLTLFWGVNWPVMKFAVLAYPPLSFRFLCMAGGVIALWAVARVRAISLRIPRGAASRIVLLAVPNMVIWHLFAIYGVALLSSGRAAILGYTMPVFALLATWLLHRRRPQRRQWVGVACAFAATVLLVSSEADKLAGAPLGTVLMLLAACGWGVGTVMLQNDEIDMPTLALTFWMLVVASLAVGAGALLLEHARWRAPNANEWWAIGFNALVVFGFCHVVWFSIARALPPVASGLSVMLIPVIGVFSGAVALGERPHWQDWIAIALVLASMATVLNLRRESPEPQD